MLCYVMLCCVMLCYVMLCMYVAVRARARRELDPAGRRPSSPAPRAGQAAGVSSASRSRPGRCAASLPPVESDRGAGRGGCGSGEARLLVLFILLCFACLCELFSVFLLCVLCYCLFCYVFLLCCSCAVCVFVVG